MALKATELPMLEAENRQITMKEAKTALKGKAPPWFDL